MGKCSKMTVESFVDSLCGCLNEDGSPDKKAMLKFIGLHVVFYAKNFPAIEQEVNRRYELERLSLNESIKIVDEESM